MRYTVKFLLIALLWFKAAHGQQNAVNVNPLDGSLNVSIPIANISNGSVSTSVNLVYGGNGIKVKDVEGSGGIGWQVTGGGQITRQLRGLPDDIKKDNEGNDRLGWLYNTNGSIINGLTLANTGSPNCTNENADKTTITNNFSNLSDTEPDIFTVNAPGLSFQFVFDNNHVIKTIPYQDLKIKYYADASDGHIGSFTITNNKGVVYSFSYGSSIIKQARSYSPDNILYFKRDYDQLKDGITYNESWKLESITDVKGTGIYYNYLSDLERTSVDSVQLYIGGATKITHYTIKEVKTSLMLSSISGGGSKIEFTSTNNFKSSLPVINNINVNGVNYILNYSNVTTPGTRYGRYFLRQILSDQCNTPFRYDFSYYGETLINGSYRTELRDSTSKSIDYWGYQSGVVQANLAPTFIINPSNQAFQRYQIFTDNVYRPDYPYTIYGADRQVDVNTVNAGALKQITYFNGGTTTISYESNNFYDPTGNTTVKGGGIRVKQVTVFDGIDASKNMVKNYTYTNPSTGVTSGKAISLPLYAFTRPYTGSGTTAEKWAASTVRSEDDLSNDDHSIYYTHVTLWQTGGGKTLYEYYVPATNYDIAAHPVCDGCTANDWAPNLALVAGPGCTPSGFVSSIISTYPFAPSLNYDFERGLLKKVTNYTDAGVKVSESEYTYVRTGSPEVTTAFKYDYAAAVLSYLKYKIYTSAGELSQQVVNRFYDVGQGTLSQQTSESYFYNSSYHKLPTRTQATKSDGTIQNSYTKYSKDYIVTSSVDPYVIGIDSLQRKNVNTPIENYITTTAGGVTKVTAATLTKFKPFDLGTIRPLPAQSLSFFDQNGVLSSNFTPSTITAGAFVNDSKYKIDANYTLYDSYGFLQTSDDNRKRIQTTLRDWNDHLPVLVATNGGAEEIGYYSYNGRVENSGFQKIGTSSNTTSGRPVQESLTLSLEPDGAFTRSIIKNSITQNYIFSLWMNPAVSGNVQLVLKGTDNVPHTYTVPFTNTAGVWKYYEIKVPVAALSTTFTASFTNTAASGVPIDDVLFYPENAQVVTYNYDQKTKAVIAETNSNGVARYYVSDKLGRLNLVYDQDKQITERKSYHYVDTYAPFLDPSYSANDDNRATVGTQVIFEPSVNYNTCQFTGITYTWNFGDGTTPIVVNTSDDQQHVFSATGTYNVSLTIDAPGYGIKSFSKPVTISPAPPPPPNTVSVLYSNYSSMGGSLNEVNFYQSNVLKYTFTDAQLSTGTVMIPDGMYNVFVTTTGTVGSATVSATGSLPNCLDPVKPNRYPSVLVQLGTPSVLTITLNDESCKSNQ